jgi:hypothetical protein
MTEQGVYVYEVDKKMSTGAEMHLHAKRLKEIIDKVDAKNEALHLSLMINP